MAGSSRDFVVNILADQTAAAREFDSFATRVSGLAGKVAGAWSAINLGSIIGDGLQAGLQLDNAENLITAQLGSVGDRAGEAGHIAGNLWSSGFVGSMEEANAAVVAVAQNLGDVDTLGAAAFDKAARSAQVLATAMGEDVTRVTAAVASMVKSGISENSDQAFNVLAAGLQTGTNKAQDLLDTFQEYSIEFAKLGLSASTALGLMNQGLEAGARNSDIVADAIKEFTLRAQEAMVTPVNPADVAAASQQVQDAYRAAGDAAAASAQSVADAEGRLADAQRNSLNAQQALTQARRDAKEALADLDTKVTGAQLGTRGAEIAVKQAEEALAAAMSKSGLDYNPTDVEAAQLRVEQAKFNLQQQRKDLRDLRREKDAANKAGVDGSQQVLDAQQRVKDNDDALRQAEQDLARTRADAAASAADSARQIQQAQAQLAAVSIPKLTTMGQAYQKLGLDGLEIGRMVAAGGDGWSTALQKVQDALRNVEDPALRTQIAVQLFGTKAEDLQGALYALDPATAKTSTSFAQVHDTMGPLVDLFGGSLQADVNATQAEFNRMGASLLGLPGADKLLVYGPALSGITSVVGPAVAALASFRTAQVVGAAVTTTGTAANVGFAASMWATAAPILAIVAAVALLGAGAYLLVKHWDKVKEWFGSFGDWLGDHWKDIAAVLLGPFGIAVRLIAKHWDSIKSGATDATEWIGRKVDKIAGFFTSIPGKVGDAISGFGDTLTSIVRAIVTGIATLWNATVGAISFTVPDWVPGLGGASFSVPDINVPAAPAAPAARPVAPTRQPARRTTVRVESPIYMDGREVARTVRTQDVRDGF